MIIIHDYPFRVDAIVIYGMTSGAAAHIIQNQESKVWLFKNKHHIRINLTLAIVTFAFLLLSMSQIVSKPLCILALLWGMYVTRCVSRAFVAGI